MYYMYSNFNVLMKCISFTWLVTQNGTKLQTTTSVGSIHHLSGTQHQ